MTWAVPGYAEIKELGRGASGRVVLALHEATQQHVAIKYLADHLVQDYQFLQAFRVEARLLSEVDSPEIASLYEYVESPGRAAIVMELVDGVSLRVMLREHGPTEPQAALLVLKGSLLGLAKAHTNGIVHRDYKPENVLVNREGQSKLADFGIAARQGLQGTHAGTPSYMAPEQWAGAAASPATDIYAATASFFECLTGHAPYSSPGDLLGLRLQHEQAPIPFDEVPVEVRSLVRRGLAKNPAHRPSDASLFLQELESLAGAAFGENWEEEGRSHLARRAALLLLLFPLAEMVADGTGVAHTILGMSRQVFAKVLVAGGVCLALLAGYSGWAAITSETPKVLVAVPPPPSPSASSLPSASATPSAVPTESPTVPKPPPPKPPSSPSTSPSVSPSPANKVNSMWRPEARWCSGAAECGRNNRKAIAWVNVTTQHTAAYSVTFTFQPVSASSGLPVGQPVVVVIQVPAGKTENRVTAEADLSTAGCRFKVSMKASIPGDSIPNGTYASPSLVTCT